MAMTYAGWGLSEVTGADAIGRGIRSKGFGDLISNHIMLKKKQYNYRSQLLLIDDSRSYRL